MASTTMRTSVLSCALLAALFSACRREPTSDHKSSPAPRETSSVVLVSSAAPSAAPTPVVAVEKPLIYLVSDEGDLWAFDPELPGNSAYKSIGHLHCQTLSKPESMAIDRSGFAWIFFSNDQLYRVSLRDASCAEGSPVRAKRRVHRVGMGFTSNAVGSSDETLFVVSEDFGLGTVSMPGLDLDVSGRVPDGELTGGGDGRLFDFDPLGGISEIDTKTLAVKKIYKPTKIPYTPNGYAFARYAGVFYLFTAPSFGGLTQTTSYDPKTGREDVRDKSLGFTVVGAGQSTRVPTPDSGSGVSEHFH